MTGTHEKNALIPFCAGSMWPSFGQARGTAAKRLPRACRPGDESSECKLRCTHGVSRWLPSPSMPSLLPSQSRTGILTRRVECGSAPRVLAPTEAVSRRHAPRPPATCANRDWNLIAATCDKRALSPPALEQARVLNAQNPAETVGSAVVSQKR